jgi:hypothetical protein
MAMPATMAMIVTTRTSSIRLNARAALNLERGGRRCHIRINDRPSTLMGDNMSHPATDQTHTVVFIRHTRLRAFVYSDALMGPGNLACSSRECRTFCRISACDVAHFQALRYGHRRPASRVGCGERVFHIFVALIRGIVANRAELAAENLALLPQRAVLEPQSKRPRLRKRDRIL